MGWRAVGGRVRARGGRVRARGARGSVRRCGRCRNTLLHGGRRLPQRRYKEAGCLGGGGVGSAGGGGGDRAGGPGGGGGGREGGAGGGTAGGACVGGSAPGPPSADPETFKNACTQARAAGRAGPGGGGPFQARSSDGASQAPRAWGRRGRAGRVGAWGGQGVRPTCPLRPPDIRPLACCRRRVCSRICSSSWGGGRTGGGV